MASVAEDCIAAVLARLQALPLYGVDLDSIRRSHRTPVTRDQAPAVHVVDGDAKPTADKSCAWHWEHEFTISVFVRDDAGFPAADPLAIEVVDRINPTFGTPYPHRARLTLNRIRKDSEIADDDAVRVDIECTLQFATGEWAIDVPAT